MRGESGGTTTSGGACDAVENQHGFVGCRADDHARALGRGKAIVTREVAIEGNQGAAVLAGPVEMLPIGRPPEVVVLEDEQHVPVELPPHRHDDAGRHVRVDVDARGSGEVLGNRPQGGRECAHGQS